MAGDVSVGVGPSVVLVTRVGLAEVVGLDVIATLDILTLPFETTMAKVKRFPDTASTSIFDDLPPHFLSQEPLAAVTLPQDDSKLKEQVQDFLPILATCLGTSSLITLQTEDALSRGGSMLKSFLFRGPWSAALKSMRKKGTQTQSRGAAERMDICREDGETP